MLLTEDSMPQGLRLVLGIGMILMCTFRISTPVRRGRIGLRRWRAFGQGGISRVFSLASPEGYLYPLSNLTGVNDLS
jgi:hypothetical protein